MLKKAGLLSLSFLIGSVCYGQTTFLPIGSEDNHVIDRFETMSGRLCDSIAAGDKPESRRNAMNFIGFINFRSVLAGRPAIDSDHVGKPRLIGATDQYNIDQIISENGEWWTHENGAIGSKHSWFNTFYTKQYDLAYVKNEDFLVIANPIFSGIAMYQRNTPAPARVPSSLFTNSQGAELRGWIGKKVGFYTSITDNQEQYPYFVYTNVSNRTRQAVPGADYFLPPGIVTGTNGQISVAGPTGRYDYMQASGYVNFDAVKDYVNVTFGSGKHFIGDGISSLFLSDYSANTPFLQVQARIWHINYECLYLELTPQFDKTQGDALLEHKFSSIHYLTWNVARWLNLGFFEAEVFDRPNVYEANYLNPLIFSTAVNRSNGEGDKSIIGMSGKAIVARRFQFYGQLVFNEFRAKELLSSRGWYGNKWGVQAGAKYFDAFSIKNLDIQAELDAVRPYTYSAKDTLANYTNYNQPLADPLGSGFVKAIGLVKYQAAKNLYLSLKATYYIQGVDTGNTNYGNTIFNPYVTAPEQYGVKMINGPKSHCEIINLNVSYQLKRNLFLDLGGTHRVYTNNAGVYPDYSTTGPVNGPITTNYVYFGVRINTARRDYDFF